MYIILMSYSDLDVGFEVEITIHSLHSYFAVPIVVTIAVYPINAERCVQHLLSERLRLSA